MNMNAFSYIPGPAMGHDEQRERMEARDAARDAAVEQGFEALGTMKWSFARSTMMAALELLEGDEELARWLFQLWQFRPKHGQTPTDKASGAFAAQQVTNRLNEALLAEIERGVESRGKP